jgi:hypothetical protein
MIIGTVFISFIIILGIAVLNDSDEVAWCVITIGKLKRARIWWVRWLAVYTLLSIMEIDCVSIRQIYVPSCQVLRLSGVMNVIRLISKHINLMKK